MLIRSKRFGEIPEAQATPEHVFLNRRVLLASGAASLGVGLIGGTAPAVAQADDPTRDLYPARRNETFRLDRPVTEERYAADYNNFYEFGSSKSVAAAARALRTRPWTVSVDGLVEAPLTIGIDDLIRRMPLEERLYRHRCVEAWAMAVP